MSSRRAVLPGLTMAFRASGNTAFFPDVYLALTPKVKRGSTGHQNEYLAALDANFMRDVVAGDSILECHPDNCGARNLSHKSSLC